MHQNNNSSIEADMKVEINKKRLEYLLALYKMSVDDLLSLLNKGRKRITGAADISGDSIDLGVLKRIGEIFDKEVSFFQDYSKLSTNASSSIFFRKTSFGTELNLESIRTVNRFESLKNALDAYNKLSQLDVKFDIEHYTLQDDPKTVAVRARDFFYPGETVNHRQFLVKMIEKIADHGIFVFEYIETWNKKEKTNIDGFYLKPNVIVLKHHKHYKREIFTLAHELGHCLLGIEEVESVDMMDISAQTSYSDVERWCNDFAYQFIMGQEAETLANIACVDSRNDYCIDLFKAISARTHISRLALYTRMYIDRKISYSSYSNVKSELAEEYRRREEQEKLKNSEKRGGRTPKPIISPLFLKTMQYAYFNGVVNETTFCSRLNVKPANFEKGVMAIVVDTCSLVMIAKNYLPLDKDGQLYSFLEEAFSRKDLMLLDVILDESNAPPKELQLKRCLSSKTRNWSFRQRIYFHVPQRDSAT